MSFSQSVRSMQFGMPDEAPSSKAPASMPHAPHAKKAKHHKHVKHTSPASHLTAAHAAHAAGDNAAAKSHALAAVNALHKMSAGPKPTSPQATQPDPTGMAPIPGQKSQPC